MTQIIRDNISMMGTKIVQHSLATKLVEDWSACRSPGRAKRRHRLGHPQHMVVRRVPASFVLHGVMYLHPEIYSRLIERVAKQHSHMLDSMMLAAASGLYK